MDVRSTIISACGNIQVGNEADLYPVAVRTAGLDEIRRTPGYVPLPPKHAPSASDDHRITQRGNTEIAAGKVNQTFRRHADQADLAHAMHENEQPAENMSVIHSASETAA